MAELIEVTDPDDPRLADLEVVVVVERDRFGAPAPQHRREQHPPSGGAVYPVGASGGARPGTDRVCSGSMARPIDADVRHLLLEGFLLRLARSPSADAFALLDAIVDARLRRGLTVVVEIGLEPGGHGEPQRHQVIGVMEVVQLGRVHDARLAIERGAVAEVQVIA